MGVTYWLLPRRPQFWEAAWVNLNKVFVHPKRDRKKYRKADTRFVFLDPEYPSVNLYQKIFLAKKWSLVIENGSEKIFEKTDAGFEFLNLDYRSVNPCYKIPQPMFFRPGVCGQTNEQTNKQTLTISDPVFKRCITLSFRKGNYCNVSKTNKYLSECLTDYSLYSSRNPLLAIHANECRILGGEGFGISQLKDSFIKHTSYDNLLYKCFSKFRRK